MLTRAIASVVIIAWGAAGIVAGPQPAGAAPLARLQPASLSGRLGSSLPAVGPLKKGKTDDWAIAVVTSPDGKLVFVTGYATGPGGGYDYATVAYSATSGAKRWVARYDGPTDGNDVANAMALSPDGKTLFVTGESADGSLFDYATIAYDATSGAQLWVTRYSGPSGGNDAAESIVASPDGSTVFVTGESNGATGPDDYATVAYNASTGTELWASRFDGPAGGSDEGWAVAVSPSGGAVFVTGWSRNGAGNFDYATVAYDATGGSQTWVARYDAGADDYPYSIGVSPDGNSVFVTGYSADPKGDNDYATIAYSASTGKKDWVSRYGQLPGANDYAVSLATAPDGSAVFVTGESVGRDGYRYATVAYDASTGAEEWVGLYPATSFAAGAAKVATSPDGSTVFVTGYVTAGSWSFGTVAYDAASGAQLWATTYGGPGVSDYGFAIAVGPDGSSVFAAGVSEGRKGNAYATVAYDASTGAQTWARLYKG